MKILTVDDSLMMRSLIGDAISALGYEKIEAASAEEALEIVEKHVDEISLILLDWNMKGMSGFELLQTLKSAKRCKHIPIMMVTTEGDSREVQKAIRTGAADYLVKPFTPEDLSTRIIGCIGMNASNDIDLNDLEL